MKFGCPFSATGHIFSIKTDNTHRWLKESLSTITHCAPKFVFQHGLNPVWSLYVTYMKGIITKITIALHIIPKESVFHNSVAVYMCPWANSFEISALHASVVYRWFMLPYLEPRDNDSFKPKKDGGSPRCYWSPPRKWSGPKGKCSDNEYYVYILGYSSDQGHCSPCNAMLISST